MRRAAAGIRRAAALALALAMGTGCANAPGPIRYEPLEGASPTTDGLHRVRTRAVAAAYLSPGVVFADYHGVVIDPVTVSYADEPRAPTATDRRRGDPALDEPAVDRLKRIYRASFEAELARSEHFASAAEAGPGVLRLSGHIVDLVVKLPPAQGREDDFVLDAGEMTLVLDVRDSQTGEPLARLVDRRAIRPASAGLTMLWWGSPVRGWSAVWDLFSRWARILRRALDGLWEAPPAPGA